MIRTYQMVTIVSSNPMYDNAIQLTCQDNKFLTYGWTAQPITCSLLQYDP
jgi:hypothetical protein